MRFFRPCLISGWLYPDAVFRIRSEEKLLILTFDDGPDPTSTNLILEILERYNIKAVFFCSGKAAENYQDLMSMITRKGHRTGNHGYNHPDGWRMGTRAYLEEVSKASEFTSSTLFRPPYGHLRLKQYRNLIKNYKIVFWDLMPYDFDPGMSSAKCLDILKEKLRPGSIIVLHDTPASQANMILPEFIEFALVNDYRFVVI